jgi:hypothetical protein
VYVPASAVASSLNVSNSASIVVASATTQRIAPGVDRGARANGHRFSPMTTSSSHHIVATRTSSVVGGGRAGLGSVSVVVAEEDANDAPRWRDRRPRRRRHRVSVAVAPTPPRLRSPARPRRHDADAATRVDAVVHGAARVVGDAVAKNPRPSARAAILRIARARPAVKTTLPTPRRCY